MSSTETPSEAASAPHAATFMRRWLMLVWALILAMVLIGGITRLTGSGLSITEWHPLMGAIPPVSQADWLELFAKYKRSPEFREVNSAMVLSDFKRIFYWEYVHRLAGRLIGVVVLLPWLYLVARRRLTRSQSLGVLVALGLGALQGLLGWFMVQSGLSSEPRVSHYRLAAHLVLAFATGQWVLWLALQASGAKPPAARAERSRVASIVTLMLLLALQVGYGGFMAGSHAGYYASTFPDMNGGYGPGPFFGSGSWLQDAVSSPLAIHYIHRALAWLVLVYSIALAVYLRRGAVGPRVRRAASLLAALVFVQFNLGALTVVTRIAFPWAVAHQAMAYLLVSSATLLLHRALRS